jgi:hypothetical protein
MLTTLRICQSLLCIGLAVGNAYVLLELGRTPDLHPDLQKLIWPIRIMIPSILFLGFVPWWRDIKETTDTTA